MCCGIPHAENGGRIRDAEVGCQCFQLRTKRRDGPRDQKRHFDLDVKQEPHLFMNNLHRLRFCGRDHQVYADPNR